MIHRTLIAGAVITFVGLGACTSSDYESQLLTGAAVGAAAGAILGGDRRSTAIGAALGTAAAALAYGQRSTVDSSACYRRYGRDNSLLNHCLEGVERGRAQQARERERELARQRHLREREAQQFGVRTGRGW